MLRGHITRLRFMHGVDSDIPDDLSMARTCEIVVSLVITPLEMAVCRRTIPSGAVIFGSSIFISRQGKEHGLDRTGKRLTTE